MNADTVISCTKMVLAAYSEVLLQPNDGMDSNDDNRRLGILRSLFLFVCYYIQLGY